MDSEAMDKAGKELNDLILQENEILGFILNLHSEVAKKYDDLMRLQLRVNELIAIVRERKQS